MSQEFREFLAQHTVSSEFRESAVREIADTVLAGSGVIDTPNFDQISADDVRLVFAEYDRRFFNGCCLRALGDSPLSFRISRRMTRRGGTTARIGDPRKDAPRNVSYEITVSEILLFNTFQEAGSTVRVTGLECHNRLQALMRIMEHECVHLAELLVWNESSCARPRFQSIAHQFFGHREHTHALDTPLVRAQREFGIRRGDRVRFRFDGRLREGIVNRITRRATVLVPDSTGDTYSDGNTYLKYYVPLPALEPLADDA